MKVGLAQINTTVGDLAGNEARLRAAYERGVAAGVDLVLAPELATTGYPPRDLLLLRGFVDRNLEVIRRLAAGTGRTGFLVGYVEANRTRPGREAANAIALLQHGQVAATRVKTLLPTYDVFDEDRYFEPAAENHPVEFNGLRLGLTICEDLWNDETFWPDRRYRRDPAVELVQAGADALFNISASPWHLGKNRVRHAMLARLAAAARRPLVYCNLVGGNDELVFDGRSLVFNRHGAPIARGAAFEEDFVVANLESQTPLPPETLTDEEKLYRALVLGLGDYLRKCGFTQAVLGLSGGIDSAVTACLAAAALGPENVHGVSLPSQFSSPGSLEDARALASNLGIRYDVIPIQPAFESVLRSLNPVFAGRPADLAEENIQARLRGVALMALSNKFGGLLLTTGNKSEIAVGYCTLYGDMCGGLAVLGDVPKTMVYRLARWINRERDLIPTASITKAPSAELRPNQTDQDSLPPYDVLDAILEAYVVEGKTAGEIVGDGFDADTVKRMTELIDRSEHKRRQAAPGLKVTSKAYGVGRRMPIAQRYRETSFGLGVGGSM
ncbi:MAG: NAD+ synthase [Verrucomicrobia bacterium]|jgi:NAD+ synthetase|nr:NAD+ synthase [Verrucomicrobiota bacterium]OQC67377.1 MAG: Glutamine-dependent NAD(+) synthetase [Verrucomicrobia bacterium ADurb.Bin006]MDI9379603.1 NAD+ synthase [Verrucomicrobiota bacterium]HOA61701.1 NAD+ synthase [Verrucomicrobiota bacterium]HOF49238.1 NAD+ synthase [Verrucomicrobiota bacterium]